MKLKELIIMTEKERLELENELLMTCSKAQAINKYIDELEENIILTNQLYKSQQENQQLYEVIEVLKETNKLLLQQKGQLQEDLDMLDNRIDKALEFSNKNWGTWCSNHIEYMTELQNILKEVSE